MQGLKPEATQAAGRMWEARVALCRSEGCYLYKVQRVEHGLQQGPGAGQLGVEDDNRGSHGVTPPQLLYEVVEALLCPTHYHMVGQLSNLLSTTYLQRVIAAI